IPAAGRTWVRTRSAGPTTSSENALRGPPRVASLPCGGSWLGTADVRALPRLAETALDLQRVGVLALRAECSREAAQRPSVLSEAGEILAVHTLRLVRMPGPQQECAEVVPHGIR